MTNLNIHRKIIPYLIAGTISFGGFTLLGHTPFEKDNHIESLDLVTTIDENGKITETYENDRGIDTATVEYYSKWRKTDDCYERDIDYYMPEDYTKKELKEIVKGDKEIKPSVHTVEKVPNLTEEELVNNKSFMRAIIVEKDNTQAITMESDFENAVTTGASIAILLLLWYGIDRVDQRRRK